ncbi:MAG TPA: helix-turn-helix domain-containing protein [Acidimicrobiales bacterium]|nr:helix-turn-helix domain-containing protein [Acidimicrobiales bacterium]
MHAALGDPHRLAIVDALTVSDVAPSELCEIVGIESNLLAHHLDVLAEVGLLERFASHGDGRRRYVRLCREVVATLVQPARLTAANVVFVCTANSARSQLAAAMWNARHRVPAVSAGTAPAERVHPQARRAAARRGLDLGGASPTRLDDLEVEPDLVVTVCDRAHEQLRRRPIRFRRLVHWSIADPAERGTARAFDEAADDLSRRVEELASLFDPSSGAGESPR